MGESEESAAEACRDSGEAERKTVGYAEARNGTLETVPVPKRRMTERCPSPMAPESKVVQIHLAASRAG